MRRKLWLLILFTLSFTGVSGQNYPWQNPLKMAWSTDGITFSNPVIFQDSSGVPSVVKWKGDTLISAFQWFRVPIGSPTWDRVAVKFSYNGGLTWTLPFAIVMNGLPAGYQRPFDPTLLVINKDSLRIYFSSSEGMPTGGLDSTINTYSALSTDGINYTFEPNARVDELHSRVIDPAVIYFNHSYHYISPIGSPQQGAYHYISPDGLHFSKVQDIPSDNSHNWTGNYMVNDSSQLRFHGCGSIIWYRSTANGGVWVTYINTNINGGDPAVVKTGQNNYLLIYVGNPYTTLIDEATDRGISVKIYPNPTSGIIHILSNAGLSGAAYSLYDVSGKKVLSGKLPDQNSLIDIHALNSGTFIVQFDHFPGLTKKILKY